MIRAPAKTLLGLAWSCACAGAPPAAADTTGTNASEGTATGASTRAATSDGEGSSAATSASGSDGSTEGASTGASTGVDTTGPGEGTGGEPSACMLSGQAGTCLDVTECPPGSLAVLGTCDDVPSIQCCLPAAIACSVDGAPGLCLPSAQCPRGLDVTEGLCPGGADVRCCTDPALACDPQAMPRPNEALVDAGVVEVSYDATCPDGMLGIDAFCVDRHEAALMVVDGQGQVTSSHSPYVHPPAAGVRAVSLEGAVPQGYIDGLTAAAACAAAGKRLCSDAEWLRACQGAAGHTYPYGDVLEPGVCNDARAQHPAIEYFGGADPAIWSMLGHPCILQVPDGLQTTGAHPGCVSDDGALDMVGNLHEWTADPDGTFRGGFFVDTVLNGPGCLYATVAHDSAHWDYSTGFRCCADRN